MIKIKFYNVITPEAYERLEDALRNFLEEQGMEAQIDNTITGNTTRTRSP